MRRIADGELLEITDYHKMKTLAIIAKSLATRL